MVDNLVWGTTHGTSPTLVLRLKWYFVYEANSGSTSELCEPCGVSGALPQAQQPTFDPWMNVRYAPDQIVVKFKADSGEGGQGENFDGNDNVKVVKLKNGDDVEKVVKAYKTRPGEWCPYHVPRGCHCGHLI